MSAIRPLATIAILAVLGVFLAMQIQNGPIASTADSEGEWGEAPAFDGGPGGGQAPAFGDPMPPATLQPPTAPATPPELPPLPPLTTADAAPSLPGLGPGPAASTPAPIAPSPVDPSELSLPDLPLPDNIPQATYPGEAPAPQSVSGRVPSLGTATPGYPVTTPPPSAIASSPIINPPTEAAPPHAVPPADDQLAPPAAAEPSGFNLSGGAAPPAPATPAAVQPVSGYATAQPAIQAALSRNELTRAHLLLSQWYGDPALSAEERREVDRLLAQLAGSVIYSAEHRLEPPHQVRAGETLESIAQQHQVPWQLLAKINGVARSDAVQPGQILKVIRGPFRATVDLSDAEVFLTVDGRYAGRFPVQLEGAAASLGAWKVKSKGTQYQPASAAADANGYARSILLTSGSAPGSPTIELGAAGRAGRPDSAGRIAIAAADLGDLFDILSEGSEVTIRR